MILQASGIAYTALATATDATPALGLLFRKAHPE